MNGLPSLRILSGFAGFLSKLAVAHRRQSGPAFELLAEMGNIAVAQPVGNIIDRQAVVHQQQLGLADNQAGEILPRRHAINLPKHPVAVRRAVAQTCRNSLNPPASFTRNCSCAHRGLQQSFHRAGQRDCILSNAKLCAVGIRHLREHPAAQRSQQLQGSMKGNHAVPVRVQRIAENRRADNDIQRLADRPQLRGIAAEADRIRSQQGASQQ
ncbi:hypothetical protein B9T62_16060 [Paenibacillus donghaensis]|uniref:Uncharacterized protein n=1 Tax=Paenibacillus donghaensis TaxID=414771 RepID=A0A2Z2KPJ1_9BACL|nr:hypothetical protein B9T62_16060 [Paenibacillus donghaensis]